MTCQSNWKQESEDSIMKKFLAASALAIVMVAGIAGAGSAAPLAAPATVKDGGGIVFVGKRGHGGGKHFGGHGRRHHGRHHGRRWGHGFGFPSWAFGWKPYYAEPTYYAWRWDGYRYVCDYYDGYRRPLCS